MTEIWLAFLTGLAGSVHCVGMCGGIVSAIAFHGRALDRRRRVLLQIAYNTGRIGTYALLGCVAGLAGASLDLLAMKEVATWVFAGANAFVAVVGLGTAIGGNFIVLSPLERGGAALLARLLGGVMAGDCARRGVVLGLVLGFLPCGLVYAPLVAAAGMASPLRGALTMVAMGAGTLPLLLTVGSAATALPDRLRGAALRMTGIFLLLIGTAGVWQVLGKLGVLPPFPLW